MLTTSSTVSHMTLSKMIPSTAACGTAANHMTQKYDSACFSEHTGTADSFFMNLVSRIAQEVRTATTTADIRELHHAVQSGEYNPDPSAIASRMLLFAEV